MKYLLFALIFCSCANQEQQWRDDHPEVIIEGGTPEVGWDRPEPTPTPKPTKKHHEQKIKKK